VTDETRPVILDLYKKYDWLNGIHFHVGSQESILCIST
jgi:diaminopimelate decarboxylase